ncbi:hypothetical protein EV178_006276 [Coemansia sp. RSA 1646]|nr:hypothetical protein EV178_006276 [Coemansia sp. RSA 1646]
MNRYAVVPELGSDVFGVDYSKGKVARLSEKCLGLVMALWLVREMCDLACIVNVPCFAHDGLRCNRQGEGPEFWYEYATTSSPASSW